MLWWNQVQEYCRRGRTPMTPGLNRNYPMSDATAQPLSLNRESYDRIAAEWNAARAAFFGRERVYLDALLDGLPRPSTVLDLGCGTGRPMAEHVIASGHRIIGVDQSVAMLAFARQRFPDETWIVGDLDSYEITTTPAAILCWDALFHLPRERHAVVLSRAAEALRPGGRLMLTAGGSAHPAFVDTMFGERFFYDSHPPDDALDLLRGLGFEMLIAEFMNLPTGGRDKGRFAIVAEKACV